jgi:uncharacterized protein (UPF0332 family)
MSVTPSEILATATILMSPFSGEEISPEANLRGSASRAYYAALHAADLSLPDDLAPTADDRKSKSSHQAIIDSVVLWSKAIRPGRTEAISVARNLALLRRVRKQADYVIGTNFSLQEAADALKTARMIIQSAERAGRQAIEALSA